MSMQQKFSELLGQRLAAAHQETADELLWQQLQKRRHKKRYTATAWFSSAASVIALSILVSFWHQQPTAPAMPQISAYQLEQIDAAIQQSIIHNDQEQIARLLAQRQQRQQLSKPQPRTYTL